MNPLFTLPKLNATDDEWTGHFPGNKWAASVLKSAEGRQVLAQAMWRANQKNDKEDLVDGLTRDCRSLLNHKFYCPEKNKHLKYNKILCYEGPELVEVLKRTHCFGFDPTFCANKESGVQIGVLIAILSDSDPTRTSSTYPILFSQMKSQKTEAYIELWRFCKECSSSSENRYFIQSVDSLSQETTNDMSLETSKTFQFRNFSKLKFFRKSRF